MFCPNCGNEVHSRFCPNCGMRLEQRAQNPRTPNMQGDVHRNNYVNDANYRSRNMNNNYRYTPKKTSGMGIAAFILSFLGPLSVFGLILGAVDLIKDKNHSYKHGLPIAALVISSLVLVALYGGNTSSVKSTSKYATSTEKKGGLSNAIVESKPDTATEKVVDVNSVTEAEPTPEPQSEPAMSKEDFMASCIELDYKAVARNPENFIGQNFKITVYVSSAREGGFLTGYQKYFVTYKFDVDEARSYVKKGYADSLADASWSARDYDQCIWLLDNRDSNSADYVKVLEDDIITVYGTFTGMQETKNSLTKETGEEVALNIKYVELIEE